MSRGDLLSMNVSAGDDLVVIVQGTKCNVHIGAHGVTVSVWAPDADCEHSMLMMTWDEIESKAVAW